MYRSKVARPGALLTRLPTTKTTAAPTAAICLGLSSLFPRFYSSATATATASEAVAPAAVRTNKTSTLYTFKDMSEQEVLFAELRFHRVSWSEIGAYFGKSSLEVFYGYIPVATRAYKHRWTSRMTLEDIVEHLRLGGQHR
ncbi:hypothetical protein BGZ97_009188 [Linnemannia gamsii]|uniref:Uncharacterized protein n=1 Tax=Linnemannia gamsii TaxID=64522 RepID=A0A9P6RBW5_9FUNG|nr:hypothetical protein BGZ97_009188 [Linnemannia gamsii]